MPAFADRAVLGASIRTLDPERPHATALAWRDGMLVAVGTDAEVRAALDGGTEVIDGRGLHLVPGLVDSHQHPFMGARQAVGADLTGMRTLAEVRAAVRAERARVGEGAWVRGFALAYEAFDDIPGGMRGDLFDDDVQGSPLFLRCFDFHTALINEPALRIAGIDGPREFVEFAEVVCVEGRPTGELREWGAISLAEAVAPEPTGDELLRLYRDTLARQAATGLTGSHVMIGDPALLATCAELEARGWLPARLVVPLRFEPTTTAEQLDSWLPHLADRGRRYRCGASKFFIDGVVETGTAWLEEPDTLGRGTAPFWPDPAWYAECVRRAAAAGSQCITHAVGDRGVRAALDAYRAAGRHGGAAPHRIEHIETLAPAVVARFAAEGVTASMQPLHMENASADQSDPWSRSLGPARCARAFPCADLRRSGAVVALGSDWPIARYDPRYGMGWARLRREPGHPERAPYGPEQALTGLETLEGYTSEAARAVGEEHVAGRIRPGFRADLTALAADPVDADADALRDVPVLLTVVDGEVVFQAQA